MDKAFPKWGVWKHIPTLSATEAIALTVNVEPTRVRKQVNGKWIASTEAGGNVSIEDFEERLFLFTRRFGPQVQMSLAELANWSQSVDWNIPVELAVLAPWPPIAHDPAPHDIVRAAIASVAASEGLVPELQQAIEAEGWQFISIGGAATAHIPDGTVKGRLEPLSKIYSLVSELCYSSKNEGIAHLVRGSGASGGGSHQSHSSAPSVYSSSVVAKSEIEEPVVAEPTQVAAADEPTLDKLFDGVGHAALEKMFPNASAAKKWKNFIERADRNGLIECKVGRALFNPLLAAEWWLATHNPDGWDLARCRRVLAKNLPMRNDHHRKLIDPASSD